MLRKTNSLFGNSSAFPLHLTSISLTASILSRFGSYGGTNRDLWIGLKDNVTEGTWYCYTGTTYGDGGVTDNISSGATWPDDSSKWRSGQPDNHGSGEDCNTNRGSLSSWTWNDFPCIADL